MNTPPDPREEEDCPGSEVCHGNCDQHTRTLTPERLAELRIANDRVFKSAWFGDWDAPDDIFTLLVAVGPLLDLLAEKDAEIRRLTREREVTYINAIGFKNERDALREQMVIVEDALPSAGTDPACCDRCFDRSEVAKEVRAALAEGGA